MNFLRGVMGGQPAGPQPSGAETIQKLCDRVASSTLLEDRRDAVRALKALSKKYRLEVASQAMGHLIHILQTDSSDSEIIGYALDTLYNIISNDEEEEQDESGQKQADDLGSQFTEIFIKEQENVTLLLSLLEEFDFHVRWPGVKLLTALLKNQCSQVQAVILVSPMGVSRLMDLLADSREVIRNDGLLLLQHLTKGNAAIQKIVAFENAFERLLDIITEEGNSDGGKQSLMLVRVMVSPVNPPGATSSCQKSMYHCGLLQQLCSILMATGVPADILTETINTVSEVIRGSQCFLYKNQKGQGEIVATLLPSTIDANSISAGQLLCGGLFSTDSVSNWCAAVALAHALQDNLTQKEQLLRVQLATSLGNPPVSLLQQCTNILSQDAQINELKTQVSSMKTQNEQLQASVTQQLSQIQQHKDQYNVLKLKLGKDSQQHNGEGAQVNGVQLEELSRLQEELEELKKQHGLLQGQLTEKDSLIEKMIEEDDDLDCRDQYDEDEDDDDDDD
ncbi:UNVERIFIED_CONTAM: hypothetical protein FKN15_034941 [Acipenser sinensis]